MLPAIRLFNRRLFCASRSVKWLRPSVAAAEFSTTTRRPLARLLVISPKRMVSSNEQVKVVNGKTAMSVFEPNSFIDYSKYEKNLKIVRDRY